VDVTSCLVGIYDKGSGALLVTEMKGVDAASGKLLFSTLSGTFARGEGGFGGDRGPSSQWALPETQPDLVAETQTLPGQALLYRMTGDRNPLHSDPAFARRGGFDRPILHGLASFGIAARLLLRDLAAGDATRLQSIGARFSRPVMPGDSLRVLAWRRENGAQFRVMDQHDNVVIDHGQFITAA
jgi:acyl dehydratase